jgi:hypothetical protein
LLTTKVVQTLESDGLEFDAKTKEDAPMVITEPDNVPTFPIGARIRRKTDGAELIVLGQTNGTIHHCPVNGGDVGMTAIDWVEAA